MLLLFQEKVISKKMDKQIGRKRNSKLAKNEELDTIPSKCLKKDRKLESLTKSQLIQKCLLLESSLIESRKVKELSDFEISNLKKQNEELKKGNEKKTDVSKVQIHTQTYPNNDVDYNCGVCVFQSSAEDPLWSHMDSEHDIRKDKENATNSCETCQQNFTKESDLKHHIKMNHIEMVTPCKYFLEGRCIFSDEVCWNSHASEIIQNIEPSNEYKCKHCDEVFSMKSNLMKHRKLNHPQNVALCRENNNNKCKYNNECWYQHISEAIINNETVKILTHLGERIKEMEEEIKMQIN